MLHSICGWNRWILKYKDMNKENKKYTAKRLGKGLYLYRGFRIECVGYYNPDHRVCWEAIDENGIKKLVAHIVFREDTKDQEGHIRTLINRLAEKLTDYMRPDYYKIRTSMPVHPNGKRDVEALKRDREGLIKLNIA